MSIKDLFLQLTKMTGPHGYEAMVWPLIPGPVSIDAADNAHVVVHKPDGSLPETMFSSHCDTADSHPSLVNHVIEGDIIKTDGSTILGADDRMGVALMIKMIEAGVPGFYVFHSGEECGRIGSRALAEEEWWLEEGLQGHFKRCIAFDRKGTTDIITHQVGGRTCSETFAKALADAIGLGYRPDPSGVYTDSLSYVDLIPECTNISVGYLYQHTGKEQQDIGHAARLLERLLQVDWEALPTERGPKAQEPDEISDVGPMWYLGDNNRTKKKKGRSKHYDWDKFSDEEWKNIKDKWDDGTPVEHPAFDLSSDHDVNLNEDSTLGVGSMVDWDAETIDLVQHCPHCTSLNKLKLTNENIDQPWHCGNCQFLLDTSKADIL